MKGRPQGVFVKAAIFVLFVALIFLFSAYGAEAGRLLGPWVERLRELFSTRGSLSRFLVSLGAYSPVVLIVLQALQVVISVIPGELTGIAAGYLYGAVFGFVVSMIGLSLGSWIAFELARFLGRPFVERFVSRKLLRKFEFLTTNTGTTVCFLLFLIPGFPKDVLCYVLGMSRMDAATFLIIATLGRMPGTFLLTLQGAAVRDQEYHTAAVAAALCVVIVFVAYLYRDRLYHWLKRGSAAGSKRDDNEAAKHSNTTARRSR